MRGEIFAEIGLGNRSFFSTEFENNGKEIRINKFIFPKDLKEVYLRIWILKRVFIISFFKGIFFRKKERNSLKILIGFGGGG